MEIDDELYVSINSRNDIRTLLTNIQKESYVIKVWQKTDLGRVLTIVRIDSIDFTSGEILLKPLDMKNAKMLEPDIPIYFYAARRKVIFKAVVSKRAKGRFLVSSPEEVRVEEMRRTPRKQYGYRSYQTLAFVTVDKFSFEIPDAQIIDASEHGIGMLMRMNDQSKVYKGLKIKILSSTLPGQEGVLAIIRNITTATNFLTGDKHLRVGVEFVEE
ncbi:MAG: hypothetical protein VX341_00715 [Bdellovibrionota bacterium]|nr:hypothetical protein [Bdellovibrionota bacterium]